MKEIFKKSAITQALPILGTIANTARPQDFMGSGKEDYNSYNESGTIYHFLSKYSGGPRVLCLNT